MILFEKDYKEQGGMIDYNTKNYSFLKMAELLKRMGIKNNKFFLHLYQPELQKYDPHNLLDSSTELRLRIAYECKINPWYYFREVVRIPSQGGDEVRYELNRANLALMWCFMNMIDIFLTMPRQKGKTVGAIALMSWIMFFAARNLNLGLFAKDNTLVLENVSRLKAIRDALPKYLVYKSKNDTDNKEGISHEALGNNYLTFIAQADKRSAEAQGRGQSLAIQQWDELAYYRNNELSYPSALATSDAAAEQARTKGIPASNIITTTAGRLSDPAGSYAYGIRCGCMRFTEVLYDAPDRTSLLETLKANSTNGMIYLEYSYTQLGEGEEWFARVTKNKDADTIARDYLNEWQQGTGTSIIPTEILKKITNSVCDPYEYTNQGQLVIRWYVPRDILLQPENKDKHFLIGGDTSDNVGIDFTTLVMLNPTDLSVIATCRCNISNLVNIVQCIYNFMKEFPRSIFIPERNKNGAFIIDFLIDIFLRERINPFYRIYNTFINDFNSKTPELSEINLSDGNNRKKFGFNTGSDSREFLYGKVLLSMLSYTHSRVFDRDLADEIKALRTRNGRIDHPHGGHDDLAVGYMLGGFFALYAKNHYMYGIPEDEILKHVGASGQTVEEGVKERQKEVRRRIAELEPLIANTQNSMMKATFERELRHLEGLVDESLITDTAITVDQMKRSEPIDTPSSFLTQELLLKLF